MGRQQTDGQVKPDFRKGDRVSGAITVEVRTTRQQKVFKTITQRDFDMNLGRGIYPHEVGEFNPEYVYGKGFEDHTEERSNVNFYIVRVPPYETNKEWRMTVENDNELEREVLCKDFHLVGERKETEPVLTKEQKEKLMKLSTPAIVTGVVLLVIVSIFGWFSGNYNSLVQSKAQVDNSWAKVETQYQRRLDLIDNVVASVKGSQGQEQKVFGQIADARKQYAGATSTDDKAAAATRLESTVAVLPRLQEAYPELKSNNQVTTLIGELSGTENDILSVRNGYNDTVTRYNVGITSFPKNLFASLFNFHPANLFKADAAASKAPKVQF